METQFHVKTIDDLSKVAKEFLNFFDEHKIFAFYGDMGVGKTTFISYLAKALGINKQVSSPTFGYVNEYSSDNYGVIYHFDLYRIESEEEAFDIGIEEYIYNNNIVFIEWAEHIEKLLPENTVKVIITEDEFGGREIEIKL